jgi:beta-glucosidase
MLTCWTGGGSQLNGEDSHFNYGREQVYPGGFFDYHLNPFRAAIAVGATQIMPYYGMPIGTTYEEVGFAFSKGIITGLLREELVFRGLVCTDWGLITDVVILGQDMPGRAWGVEHLSEIERVEKIINAGCDQFGGEARPELVMKLAEEGRIPISRVDEFVARILHEKFDLGLFDQPFIEADKASRVVGRKDFCKEGELAQRRVYTLLKNKSNILPLCSMAGKKIYIEGIEASGMSDWTIVDNPAEADIALLRLKAPFEPRPGGFEARFHAGSLEYPKEEQEGQAAIFKAVPTGVDVYLDRPAVIPEIAYAAAALLVSYGSSSEAFLDVDCGRVAPEGKLPFDLPSSMEPVVNSRSDVPYDTKDPIDKFGYGLKYTE